MAARGKGLACRVRTIRERSQNYLEEYRLRHKSYTFAEYAVGNVTTHLGKMLLVAIQPTRSKSSSRLGFAKGPLRNQ